MAVMTTWDLFEDLRAAQDQMLRTQVGHPERAGRYVGDTEAWAPAVDISERKDAYVVAVELPGVKADEFDITFEDGLLTVQGQRRPTTDATGERMHRSERRYGAFRRSITLPSHVQSDKIEASAQDGVLQVLVPKAAEVQAKRIKVRAGQDRAVTPGTVTNGNQK